MTSVLFLCVHNSARSQMAEGFLRARGGARYEVFSAGNEATIVRPLAIRAMAEVGIDISRQTSKTIDALPRRAFDYVVTVCDDGTEACPYVPAIVEQLHWPFDDPSAAAGSEEDQLTVFRRVRDQIGEAIRSTFV